MKIYDLSPLISEGMAVYKNKSEKKPKIKITGTLKEGSNESKLEIESHIGSHVMHTEPTKRSEEVTTEEKIWHSAAS